VTPHTDRASGNPAVDADQSPIRSWTGEVQSLVRQPFDLRAATGFRLREDKGVSDAALYYPHVHLPGDDWVKAAILHWPLLARIRPNVTDSPYDSVIVRQLEDEGVILGVDPRLGAVLGCQGIFYSFLLRHAAGKTTKRKPSEPPAFATLPSARKRCSPRSCRRPTAVS
jgi:hypothetical protein